MDKKVHQPSKKCTYRSVVGAAETAAPPEKSWQMQRPSSSPYPFDTQRATLKMEDIVDILRKIADCSRKLKTLQHRNIR